MFIRIGAMHLKQNDLPTLRVARHRLPLLPNRGTSVMRFQGKARSFQDSQAPADSWVRLGAISPAPAAIVQPGPQHANVAPTFSAPALQMYRASTTMDGSSLNAFTYSAAASPDGT